MRIMHGDCIEVMAEMIENGESVDSVVCDPPYHLTSIVKRFGETSRSDNTKTSDRSRRGADRYARLSTGFMGKKWDGGDIAFQPEVWKLCLDLLPPGGHLLAFGGTRTYHRMACAIEDAGFEIRDQIGWLYGSGFPKSHNLDGEREGWGTALKPAWEPIVLARKPLNGTVAANVQQHGTGALNIDGCRVGPAIEQRPGGLHRGSDEIYGDWSGDVEADNAKGRWPANVVHDGSGEVLNEFAKYGEGHARGNVTSKWHNGRPATVANAPTGGFETGNPGDTGTPARFFYCAKADSGDRLSSKHPTVKPVDLMAWLIRLITPPGGTVIDPFAGSGTTGMACIREGFNAILIEREAEYVKDIKARLDHIEGKDTPLFSGEPA